MRKTHEIQRHYFRLLLRRSLWMGLAIGVVSTSGSFLNAQDRSGTKGAQPKVQAQTASASKVIKDADVGPAVVALVNGQQISLQDLAQQCVLRHGETILENIVNKYMILQACQQRKIEITPKDVDDEIARVAAKFNLNVPMYLKLLQDERNITPEQYASDIIWQILCFGV